MPRPGPRRPLVAIRMSDEGIAYVDQLAEEAGVNRSEMIRTLLKEAIAARAAKR
jgi:metal-responsive CopG/Arc/MetJ family transcriptional regulator